MSELHGPRQVVLVSCRHEGKDDIIAVAWHMPTSFKPPLYAISIGLPRFSHDVIKNSGAFCVNFIADEQREMVIKCGTSSGRNVDKFREFKIAKEECETIECPKIKKVVGFLECRVVESVETGDHTIFIGEVLKSNLQGHGKRIYHIDGTRFATVSD
ncbi:MAG: flavin reductase [Candidatus Aenigmatarchaeota archaeon]|nr:MAG: flavin reductase [Candidatus Aenigmarchaeota archaeon]